MGDQSVTNYEATLGEAWSFVGTDNDRAAALARAALVAYPDGIDAYVALAATKELPVEAIALLREAVLIATKMLKWPENPDGLQADGAGYDFRGHLRALSNLARLLWADDRPGSREEAIALARRAVRLDPDDTEANRYLLMAWEASVGNWEAARRIALRSRSEWRMEARYWLALHAFRDGDASADNLLDKAIAASAT